MLPDVPEARSLTEPRDVDASPIAWREAGTGTTVVFLHGLGGSRISWEPQLAALGTQVRAVAWDMPGYGASAPLDVADVRFHHLADAAAAWIDRLTGSDAHVVGISMGGMVAQYLAATHPHRVRSLVLLSTSPKFGLDGTTPDQWRSARLAPLDQGLEPADFADRVLRSIAGPGISAAALEQQRAAMARVSGRALRRSIDCLVHHDARSLLHSITAPTVCAVGSFDEETPVAYSQAIVDGIHTSRLEVIEGAGHLLNVEAPDHVNRLIAEHVTQVERAKESS